MHSNSNGNSRSVNFSGEFEFSLNNSYTKNERLRSCFSRILATDDETNMAHNFIKDIPAMDNNK